MRSMILRELRRARGLTLNDIQLLSKIPPSRLSLIERGYLKLKPEEVQMVAEALGVDSKEIPSD